MRLIIVEAGLPEPMVNATIRNSHGEFLALGDLVYPKHRILIEYDGAHHFAGDEQLYKDIDRLDAVMEEGWRVVRLNKTHLRRPSSSSPRFEQHCCTPAGAHDIRKSFREMPVVGAIFA